MVFTDHLDNDLIVQSNKEVTVSSPAAEQDRTGADEPTFPVVEVTEEDSFDPRLLEALGEFEVDSVDFGDDIQTDLAARLEKILISGLNVEAREEISKKYLFPKNLALAKGPTLNLEVGAMLAEPCKQRDKRLLGKQDQLGKALSVLTIAMTSLMKKNSNVPDIIRILNDAARLLADSHYTETDTRRSVIIPLVDKPLMEPFKDRKRDSLLFGENLGDLVRDSRGIKKTSELIQASTSSTHLNRKGSSARGAKNQQRGGRNQRGGGPRSMTSYQYPRRWAPSTAQLPPQARRPSPPPAPRRRQYTAGTVAPTSRYANSQRRL